MPIPVMLLKTRHAALFVETSLFPAPGPSRRVEPNKHTSESKTPNTSACVLSPGPNVLSGLSCKLVCSAAPLPMETGLRPSWLSTFEIEMNVPWPVTQTRQRQTPRRARHGVAEENTYASPKESRLDPVRGTRHGLGKMHTGGLQRRTIRGRSRPLLSRAHHR